MIGEGRNGAGFRAKLDVETRLALMTECERYAWRMAYLKPTDRSRLYTNDFRQLIDETTARDVICQPWDASDAGDRWNRLMNVDVLTYLPNALLAKTDITSMAHSLEVRSPFLDHELMEFAARLPGAWKVSGADTKRLFKDAMQAWLPASIIDRPKRGFGAPIDSWFRHRLRFYAYDVLLDPAARARGWFEQDAMRQIIDDHAAGLRDNSTKLWALIQLELWIRTFIEKPAQPAISL